MLVSHVEKYQFVISIAVLYLQSRDGWQMAAAAAIDAFWGVMILVSYVKTRAAQTTS
jgi:hypothetical protein